MKLNIKSSIRSLLDKLLKSERSFSPSSALTASEMPPLVC